MLSSFSSVAVYIPIFSDESIIVRPQLWSFDNTSLTTPDRSRSRQNFANSSPESDFGQNGRHRPTSTPASTLTPQPWMEDMQKKYPEARHEPSPAPHQLWLVRHQTLSAFFSTARSPSVDVIPVMTSSGPKKPAGSANGLWVLRSRLGCSGTHGVIYNYSSCLW